MSSMKIVFDNISSRIKSSVSRGMFYCGLLELMKRLMLKNKGFILMYHRVLPSKEDSVVPIQPGMYVTHDTFERHLIYLKNNMHVIPLDELVGRIQLGKSLNHCCSITFDDGWYDNYVYAFPLLKKYGVPATIFLATGYVGTNKWFWPEELSRCLPRMIDDLRENEFVDETIQIFLSKLSYKKTVTMYNLLERAVDTVKHFRPQVREDFLNRLMALYPRDEEQRLLMNWEEAMEMYEDGLVSFGAHTVNHLFLDELESESIRKEILGSQEHIKMNLGYSAKLFAYPNGNYSPSIVKFLKENSFHGAVTTRKGFVECDTPQMELPRIAMHDDVSCSTDRFISRILMNHF